MFPSLARTHFRCACPPVGRGIARWGRWCSQRCPSTSWSCRWSPHAASVQTVSEHLRTDLTISATAPAISSGLPSPHALLHRSHRLTDFAHALHTPCKRDFPRAWTLLRLSRGPPAPEALPLPCQYVKDFGVILFATMRLVTSRGLGLLRELRLADLGALAENAALVIDLAQLRRDVSPAGSVP